MPYRPPRKSRYNSRSSGERFLKNRETGLSIGPNTSVYAEDAGPQSVDPYSVIWRYQPIAVFTKMVESSSLYFRRADKYPDALEGTLSTEKLHGTSRTDKAFAEAYPMSPVAYTELVRSQEALRRTVFVNCWHQNKLENPVMWAAYGKDLAAVTVASTPFALAVNLPPLVQIAGVRYVDKREPRTRLSHSSLFFYKDKKKYAFEKELRLLIHATDKEILWDDEKDFSRTLPVNLAYIHRVVFHPRISEDSKLQVHDLLAQYLPSIQAEDSRI